MADKKRVSRTITASKDLQEILSLTYDRAREKSLIMDYFGDYGDGPRFNPYDIITVPKGTYGGKKKNKNDFVTTVGLWVFNKSFLEPFADIIGYVNEPVTDHVYNEINQKISYALLEDKITVDQLKNFINQTQIVMSCASAICPSHTMDMLLLTNSAEKEKAKVEKEHADGLENKDLTAIKAVEDDLIDFAKDKLRDSESVDMYNSGARSSWGNNFKNMYLVKGSVRMTDGSYDYIGSSYMSGLDPKDFVKANDSAVGGPYSRSNKTRSGGYSEKLFTRLTQHIKILPKGSDCHTKHTIIVHLTEKNIDDWMYCFIQNNNGTVTEITTDNRDKLIGKTVHMRYASLCESKDGICETCAGSLFRRAGIENAGLVSMVMMSSVKNGAMKAFHDSTLDLVDLDPDKIFSLK